MFLYMEFYIYLFHVLLLLLGGGAILIALPEKRGKENERENKMGFDNIFMEKQISNFLDEVNELVPPTIPVYVYAQDHEKEVRVDLPGIEVTFEHSNGKTYFVIPHVIADFDYAGQVAYFQIALKGENPNNPNTFGKYRYCFAYRGGDSSWDDWHIDINFGTNRPTYQQFGEYADKELKSNGQGK